MVTLPQTVLPYRGRRAIRATSPFVHVLWRRGAVRDCRGRPPLQPGETIACTDAIVSLRTLAGETMVCMDAIVSRAKAGRGNARDGPAREEKGRRCTRCATRSKRVHGFSVTTYAPGEPEHPRAIDSAPSPSWRISISVRTGTRHDRPTVRISRLSVGCTWDHPLRRRGDHETIRGS